MIENTVHPKNIIEKGTNQMNLFEDNMFVNRIEPQNNNKAKEKTRLSFIDTADNYSFNSHI